MNLHNLKQARPASHELALFEDSILALYLGQYAPRIFEFGALCHLAEGESFILGGTATLTVVLDGVLVSDSGWQGPGCHVEGDGTRYTVKSAQAVVWVLDRSADSWRTNGLQALQVALGNACWAAERGLQAATPPAQLPDPETLSDVDHPQIRRTAARLRRTTPEATADAIFRFVQAMPYRFGNWQERASDTLARGNGMCTTKANLQVTLMRAAGLEAGFVEMPMSMSVLGKLMPSAWLAMMRPTVRHYFGAVKLGGRWHAADSSYNDDSMGIYLESFPDYAHLLPAHISAGKPYSPTAEKNGVDPFDIQVVPHLNEEMSKKSRFSPAHFEALNTRLDRAQGSWRNWVEEDHPDLGAGLRVVS
jgi:hypothetical protein